MEYLDRLLEQLTDAVGIGYTGDVGSVIVQALEAEGIRASVEQDGSVCAFLKGSGVKGVKNVMIACHLDEIGYVVSRIDEAGRLFISEVGGADVRILPGQEMSVLGKKAYSGYVAFKPPHLLSSDERERVLPLEDLFIDLGIKPEVVKRNIQLGDYVTFSNRYTRMPGGLRAGKSMDNRAGVACGIQVLREMAKMEHSFNVHMVATSQEEYTGLGARIHSFRLPIDYAIVVDVTHAEHPDLKEYEVFPLSSGPAIVRGATIPPALSKLLLDTARSLEIPYQVEANPSRTGTDADDIAFNREGIPSCIVGIPLRYMHTPVEVVSLTDIELAARLITHSIIRLQDLPPEVSG
jgi:putative aminopeptidase FrvX